MWDGQSGFGPVAAVSDETHQWLGGAREIEMNCLGPDAGGIRHGIWCLIAPGEGGREGHAGNSQVSSH